MRVIVFVPGNFPPTTGAIVYDNRLAGALRDLGHDVATIPVGGQHPLPDEASRTAAATVWQQHRETDATIVIDGFCLYAFDALAQDLGARRVIALLHHPMSQEPHLPHADRAVFTAIEGRLLPQLRRILVPSADVAAQIATATSTQIDVLTPGLPDAPRSAGSGGPGCRLLAVGSLIPRKGHDVLLRALVGLPDLDWTLTICGDDSIDPHHAAALRALAETLGIAERVAFAGSCRGDVMEHLWHTADIFVSCSSYEGYGMAVAEAVRRGIPLALTQGAAASEVIPAAGSAIVERGDHVQLRKALRRLVFSETLRRSLSDAAWAAGQSLPSWQDRAERFLRLATTAPA
jgi:glycosyltransferase involved in cell wall biosynthesis